MLNNKKKQANTRFFNSRHFPFILFGENTYFGNSKKKEYFTLFSISILFLPMFARSIKPFASRLCGIRTYYGKIIPDHKLKYVLVIFIYQKICADFPPTRRSNALKQLFFWI